MPRLTLLPLTNDLKQPWLVLTICNSRDGTVHQYFFSFGSNTFMRSNAYQERLGSKHSSLDTIWHILTSGMINGRSSIP